MIQLVAHADWSVAPAKRWMSVATPSGAGWRVGIEKVGDLETLLARLRHRAAGGPVALGVDAPIGLPRAYPHRHGDFPAFLRSLSRDDRFFRVCDAPGEIGPGQPFYPRSSRAGVRRKELLDGLGMAGGDDLLRLCERKLGPQPAASPMFWTLGANQVGKGAICLWRDLLIPALAAADPPSLWPFDGSLDALLRQGRTVIAETYPANAMRQMGLRLGLRLGLGLKGSKRRQSDRRSVAPGLRTHLHDQHAEPDADLSAQIDDGFGAGLDGEDRFDSLVGLVRMLQIIRDPVLDQLPDPAIRRWEGWILGRPLSTY